MMQHRIGSVYLDAPRRPSRKEEAVKARRPRTMIAGVALFIGLLSLTIAGVIAGVRAVVLDPDAVVTAFEATIDDPIARAELEHQVAEGIEEGLVGPELVAIATAFDLEVAAEAERVSLLVLDDPAVREELRLLVAELHGQLVIERSDDNIDLAPITTAVMDVIAEESPRLAAIIPTNSTLWTVESTAVPDFTGPADLLNQALLVALMGALLVPIAVAIHPRRHRAAVWVGRWALTMAILCGVAAIGLPYAAGNLSGWSAVEIAVRALTLKLLAPAAIAAVIGTGLVSFAAVIRHRENRRTADEGAAAALGAFDEPPLLGTPSAPTFDLAKRGLIDVNHPLTSI
jgi:hypothetical protein